jgi:hypothetical protein
MQKHLWSTDIYLNILNMLKNSILYPPWSAVLSGGCIWNTQVQKNNQCTCTKVAKSQSSIDGELPLQLLLDHSEPSWNKIASSTTGARFGWDSCHFWSAFLI